MRKGLEGRLREICDTNPKYTALISTWELNKQTCIDALKNVVINYPHFSMHDVSHSEAVITKIEMLLGDRIDALSPTDIWLILHAAYVHDLGMILKWNDIEKLWEEPKFKRFLTSLKDSMDNELGVAAKMICMLLDSSAKKDTVIDPLKVSQYVTLVNAAYFRKYHSSISRKYVDLWETGLNIDLAHSNLIQKRLIKLLGEICELHTMDAPKVLDLDYQTDGYAADYAHPRLVAMMLRLGDLLDADNGRFNRFSTMTIGGLPEGSISHADKHEATLHLLVTPKDIEFRSNCPTPEAYLETRKFISWLESELDFLKKNWIDIVPENLGGYVPHFEKKEIFLKDIPDVDGVADLKFEISQEKAFQIVEGSNIYKNKFVCIREIIQNAMDATKIQLWKDLSEGNYSAWIESDKINESMQPFDIDAKIYENYAIEIVLDTLPNGKTQVDIIDRGTGISLENFKRMCNVGESTSVGENNEEVLSKMPKWLRPTAGFGIGMQSIFLVTDHFEILTSTGTETFNATVHSNRSGGYLQLRKSDVARQRGTLLRFQFEMTEEIFYEIYNSDLHKEDYFVYRHCEGEKAVIEEVAMKCNELFFPIHIKSSVKEYNKIDLLNTIPVGEIKDWSYTNDDCLYELFDDCSKMKIWDLKDNAYGEIHLSEDFLRDYCKVSFKGIFVYDFWGTNGEILPGTVDVCGLDTKKTLALDRSNFTKEGRREIKRILDKFKNIYVNKVLEKLKIEDQRNEICLSEKLDLSAFWLICGENQRREIPIECFDYMSRHVEVLTRNVDKNFDKDEKLWGEILKDNSSNIYFLKGILVNPLNNLENFSQRVPEAINELVWNDGFQGTFENAFGKDLKKEIIVLDGKILIYSVSKEEGPVYMESQLWERVILGLMEPIVGLHNTFFPFDEYKRLAIPMINKYEKIAVERIPVGVVRTSIECNQIISPFVRKKDEENIQMAKEIFVKEIMDSEQFGALVQYVKEHGVHKDTVSEEEIKQCYKCLMEEFYDIKTKQN